MTFLGHEAEQAKGLSLISRLGLRPEVQARCFVDLTGRPNYGLVSYSDTTPDEMRIMADAGLQLLIAPSEEMDLSLIAGSEHFRRVMCLGSPPIVGLRALERFDRLEHIAFNWDLPEQVDFSQLPNLVYARLQGVNALSVASNPHIQVLNLEMKKRSLKSLVVDAPELREMYVHGGRALASIRFGEPNKLVDVVVAGSGRFQVDSLLSAPGLESLEFYSCQNPVGLATILELPKLVTLGLSGTRSDEPMDFLLKFEGRVVAEPNYVLPDALLTAAGSRFRGWEVSRYRGRALGAYVTPFSIFSANGEIGISLVDFGEIDAISGLAGAPGAAEIARQIAQKVLEASDDTSSFRKAMAFDSEADTMFVRVASKSEADVVLQVLNKVWSNPVELRKVVKSLGAEGS